MSMKPTESPIEKPRVNRPVERQIPQNRESDTLKCDIEPLEVKKRPC